MFSGIVQSIGVVRFVRRSRSGRRIQLQGKLPGGRLRRGESIAVDGVCLTVERAAARGLEVTAVPETLRLTTLGRLERGARVNLERALRFGDPVGGHLVQGHVDGIGRVRGWTVDRRERRVRISAPPAVRRDLAYKGSVTVNGVSLTVAGLDSRGFEVALIPHTLEATTLAGLRAGDPVNLEIDLFSRYLRTLLGPRLARPRRRRRRGRRKGARGRTRS